MHVAMVTDAFTTGGGQEQLFQIVRALPEVRFSVWARGGDPWRFRSLGNATVHTEGLATERLLSHGPDLIHLHHLKPLLGLLLHPQARRLPVPVLFTAHGLHVRKYDYRPGVGTRTGKLLRSALERRLFRKVDCVIAVSRQDERFLRVRYGLERVAYIPNGVDVATLAEPGGPPVEALRREMRIAPGEVAFLTVARFDFQKGYDVLLDAVRMGRERFRRNRVVFVWVGDGKERPALERRAGREKLGDLVRFLGEKPLASRWMRACDLFVLPSRWEGLPLSLLEAVFSRVPVAASNACGNAQIVSDGVNGRLFENGDPDSLRRVLEALSEPEARKALSPGPPDTAFERSYDIAHTARALECLYRLHACG